ncbi:MAG: FtsW/RodA/SpoVE family cell cycle protein, partial [Smithellaceae bacterium]|nr:FtsW/RodA/SpoVE family cell cycle protein [Smithellaceae bacterium]
PDMLLLVATLALITFGTVMIYSSSSLMALEKFKDGEFFIKKQIFFVTIGMVTMVLFSKIHYTIWRKLAYPILFVSVAMLCLLLVPGFGVRAGGATRWLRMGIASFQVSELVKVGMVIFLSDFLSKRCNHVSEIKAPFFVALGITGLVAFLILRQPDYGTAMLVSVITLIMFFLAGIK